MRNHMKLMLLSTTLLAVGLGGCSVATNSISQESAMVQNIPDETLNIDKNANEKFEAEIKVYGKLRLKELMAKANQGDQVAQYEVGNRYHHGKKMDAQGLPKNYKKAMEWYHKAAEQGYGPALERLQK
jgi:TPR repeat protein